MSEADEAEAKPVEVPEEPGKKFFISHVNSYTGRALLKELNNKDTVKEEWAAHTFDGTLEAGTNDVYTTQYPVAPEGVDNVVKMERTRDFRESVLEADVIIYDLVSNQFEEVDYVIKTLKTSKLTQAKTLILLSSVMTWVNTPPKEKKEGEEEEGAGDEEGGEEAAEESEPETEQDVPEGEEGEEKPAKKKILPFKESDHHQRVAHASFFNMKNLETLALSAPKTQPLLKVHILCAGIRYGLGEAVFYDHFKNAWLQAPSELPIIGEGKNLIPTIHICDLARVTKRIVAEKVQKEYIFAVDRTPRPTQKRLIQAISNGIGTGKTREMEPDDIADSIIWKDFLSINLKMKTSDVFKDGEAAEDAEDPEAEAAALKFPWHCEKGIFANAKQLNVEFNEARGLNPVKLCVTGPPAAGKTYYAEKIEQYYNIPRVHVKELTDQAFVMAAAEEEEGGDGGDAGALAADIKARVGELREAKAADMTAAIEAEREAMEARGEKVPEDPAEVDPATVSIRIPDEFVYKLLQIRLNENDCRNRGYILDGFPRSYEDAQHIFLKRKEVRDEEGNIVEEEEEPLEEGQKKNFDAHIKDESICPSSVIVLRQQDDFLMKRVQQLAESRITGTHYNPADMARRLKAYRVLNDSQVAEPSVQQFFKAQGVQLYIKDAAIAEGVLFDALKIYIERVEKPNNFQHKDEGLEAKRRIMVQADLMRQAEFARQRILREEGIETELRKQKEAHTKANLASIREEQKEQLDQKSQPIRQYLSDNLVPILTDGLIEVCRTQPDDPTDALAEYLFKRSLDVPYPDPCSYIE